MENNYLKDIGEIKNLMNESSKFLVFTTGLSGFFSGLFAIAGMAIVYSMTSGQINNIQELVSGHQSLIIIVLTAVFVLSLLITLAFTKRNARSKGNTAWNPIAKKMVFNFYSILVLGGAYLFILFFQKQYEPIVELMLIFYGIALLNGAKYTFGEVRILAYVEITLGLICALLPGYDFWFWTVGFGLVNLIYGSIMYFGLGK